MDVNTRERFPFFHQEIPFVGMPLYRDTSAKDQRFTNIIFEKIDNPLSGNSKVRVIKRPGLAQNTQPPAGNATPRGIHYWDAAAKLYTVFNDKIYAGTTDLGVTLAASSGRCWFTETPSGFGGGQRLLVSDGTKLYAIQTDNTVTTISTSSDADFPTSNLGTVVFFDSYIVLAKDTGAIYNSDVDTFADWGATSFLSAEMFGDYLVGIAKQRDHLVALGSESIEFFYDNENTPGSPFERRANMALQIGCVTIHSMAQQEDTLIFVGKSKTGGRGVWEMHGLEKIEKVSTPAVERLLEAEAGTIGSCRAFLLRVQGQLLYILSLSTLDRTLVYHVNGRIWSEWAGTAGGRFSGVYATSSDTSIFIQDVSNGRTYTFSPSTYQDNGSNFTVTLLTDKFDFENNLQKFASRLEIIGDTTTGNLAVSYSDDDYTSFSTARNIDMSQKVKYLTQLGTFQNRAWKFTYTDNYALRLERFDLTMRQGLR